MTEQEAKRLLPQTVIMRDGDQDNAGTVRLVGYTGFGVDWASGQQEFVDFADAENITLWDSYDVGN